MKQNAISCLRWRLYVIIDRAAAGARSLSELTDAAIRGGADAIQLRDKTSSARHLIDEARHLLSLTQVARIPFILNDRVDIAVSVGTDGVHLGQEDLPIQDARRMLGEDRIIGKSPHSLEQALAAEAEGANYLGLGPIFPTPTKPEYGSVGLGLINQVVTRVRLPVVCIGGIDAGNVAQVLQAGAERVAVVRAICSADNPERATRALKHTLTQFLHTTTAPSL